MLLNVWSIGYSCLTIIRAFKTTQALAIETVLILFFRHLTEDNKKGNEFLADSRNDVGYIRIVSTGAYFKSARHIFEPAFEEGGNELRNHLINRGIYALLSKNRTWDVQNVKQKNGI